MSGQSREVAVAMAKTIAQMDGPVSAAEGIGGAVIFIATVLQASAKPDRIPATIAGIILSLAASCGTTLEAIEAEMAETARDMPKSANAVGYAMGEGE